jgi:hypothetical protein
LRGRSCLVLEGEGGKVRERGRSGLDAKARGDLWGNAKLSSARIPSVWRLARERAKGRSRQSWTRLAATQEELLAGRGNDTGLDEVELARARSSRTEREARVAVSRCVEVGVSWTAVLSASAANSSSESRSRGGGGKCGEEPNCSEYRLAHCSERRRWPLINTTARPLLRTPAGLACSSTIRFASAVLRARAS